MKGVVTVQTITFGFDSARHLFGLDIYVETDKGQSHSLNCTMDEKNARTLGKAVHAELKKHGSESRKVRKRRKHGR